MKATKELRAYKKAAKRAGATVVKVARNGHYHITLAFAGQKKMFTVACSPGDVRGFLNYEAQVKRWIRDLSPARPSDPTTDTPLLPLFSSAPACSSPEALTSPRRGNGSMRP